MTHVVHAVIDGRERYYAGYTAEGIADAEINWQVTITNRVLYDKDTAERIASNLRQWGWAVVANPIHERIGPRGGKHIEVAP